MKKGQRKSSGCGRRELQGVLLSWPRCESRWALAEISCGMLGRPCLICSWQTERGDRKQWGERKHHQGRKKTREKVNGGIDVGSRKNLKPCIWVKDKHCRAKRDGEREWERTSGWIWSQRWQRQRTWAEQPWHCLLGQLMWSCLGPGKLLDFRGEKHIKKESSLLPLCKAPCCSWLNNSLQPPSLPFQSLWMWAEHLCFINHLTRDRTPSPTSSSLY